MRHLWISFSKLALLFLVTNNCSFDYYAAGAAFYMHRASKQDFAQTPSIFEDEPVVVEEVLSPDDCGRWLSHILTRSKNEMVELQRPHSWTNVKLSDATDLVLQQSSHADPLYVSSTKSSCFMDQLPLYDLIESLFDNEDTKFDDTINWFPFFAPHAHIHDTLVIAGEGATSPCVECRPFTKMSLCIDGSQLWRILPPISETQNQQLKVSAETVTARSWEGLPFSIGYQAPSTKNLFAFRHDDVSRWEDDYFEDDDDDAQKYEDFQQWAEDPNMLVPNLPVPKNTDGHQWHSTVALAGDLIVIPPGWWYQSYNLEPGVSIQSQRCGGSEMATTFIHHILETIPCRECMSLLQKGDYQTAAEAQAIVDSLFELLQEHSTAVDADRGAAGT